MTKETKVTVEKMVYAKSEKPIEPIREEHMDITDGEFAKMHKIWEKEVSDWEAEQEEAKKLDETPEAETENPGPGIDVEHLVSEENPVWTNTESKLGTGPSFDPDRFEGPAFDEDRFTGPGVEK